MTKGFCAAAGFFFLTVNFHPSACSQERNPLVGFVIHFDSIQSNRDGLKVLEVAKKMGAEVINLVPPAHVWERPKDLAVLDGLIAKIGLLKMKLIVSRIDASYLPDSKGERLNFLYDKILKEPGTMPTGAPTVDFFLATAHEPGYENWLEEETRFYARRYGKLPNLIGFNLGPFSEPFVSQRGGFLQFDKDPNLYEITQYTRAGADLWHDWLFQKFGGLEKIQNEYEVKSSSIKDIPIPKNETDPLFGRPERAYFDWGASLNDWLTKVYEQCRAIWHKEGGGAPFIWQFSGYDVEKWIKARPEVFAFNPVDWIGRADAVGLSIYTNNGYADYGHSSIIGATRLLNLAHDLGKGVFVMESGSETPYPVLNESEFNFIATAALATAPQTFIYEFTKTPYYSQPHKNDGHLIDGRGRLQRPVQKAIRELFGKVKKPGVIEKPKIFVVLDPQIIREHPEAGKAYQKAFQLAGTMPVSFISPAQKKQAPSQATIWDPGTNSLEELDSLAHNLRNSSGERISLK